MALLILRVQLRTQRSAVAAAAIGRHPRFRIAVLRAAGCCDRCHLCCGYNGGRLRRDGRDPVCVRAGADV